MDLSFPEAEHIDSRCERKMPDPETSDPLLPRCGAAGETWFNTERGSRLYVCGDHAREVLRFGEADRDVLDMDYNELRSYAKEQGLNLHNPTLLHLRRRLLVAPDASELPDHPRVSPCRGCSKLTLLDDLDYVDKRCPACRDDHPELDVDEAVLSSSSEV